MVGEAIESVSDIHTQNKVLSIGRGEQQNKEAKATLSACGVFWKVGLLHWREGSWTVEAGERKEWLSEE